MASPGTERGSGVEGAERPAGGWEGSDGPGAQDQEGLEAIVASVWAEILEIDEPSRETDFFALGGSSLMGAMVIGRLREIFDMRIPVRHLFDGQTIRGLAARIAQLRDSDAATMSTIGPALERPESHFRVPASSFQQRLWVIEQFQGPSATYNIPGAVEVDGAVDLGALERALEHLVARHEVLRTTFEDVDGVPCQVVWPRIATPFQVIDLRDAPEEERQVAAIDHIMNAATQPFDLVAGPLLRMEALRLDEDWHVLFFNMHHIITDLRSIELFLEELLAAYTAIRAGATPDLEPAEVQYADFAAWQQQSLDEVAVEEQLEYWRRRLEDPPPPLELPADRVRPATPSGRGATETVELSRGRTRGLRSVARKQDASLFMAVLAVYSVLLRRHTGQTDLVIGTPSTNREQPELERMLGFFVNTLAMRVDLSGDPTFAELIERVRGVALGAYAHQDLPFERVVAETQADRQSTQPVFQTMLAFQPDTADPQLPDAAVAPLDLDTDTAKFDLSLAVTERRSSLRLSLEYSTDLFAPDRARRMLGHLVTLIESATTAPHTPISQLAMLTSEERARMREWSAPAEEIEPSRRCLHESFADQVSSTPDAVAAVAGSEQLTFRELDARADRLARELRLRGAGREHLVALCLERSLSLIVGILGVLKAGAAFVPLDPAAPTERLALMLGDAGATLLVASPSVRQRLPSQAPPTVLLSEDGSGSPPEAEPWLAAESPAGDPAPWEPADPSQLAYVMYTSGSTGAPKGVQVTHEQVSPLLEWARETLRIGPGDRVAQYSSYFFDASVYEMFQPLLGGGTLVVVGVEDWLDPEATADLVSAHDITALIATPTQMRRLVAVGRPMPSLRLLSLGAERLPFDLVPRCRELLSPDASIWNVYGPTECAIAATATEVGADDDDHELAGVPIGRPIAGARLSVLDEDGNEQPVGVSGELHIGGQGVARGYLGRPGATAERFVPDPDSPGERRYRTGDEVRWLPDGRLAFLGRLDEQVKIRGIRVEPGEVEATLLEHPAISAAVVVADDGRGSQEPRLLAYLVMSAEETLASEAIRAFLVDRLPAYMVPARFVRLASIPYTPNGKVDRQALPAADEPEPAPVAAQGPETPLERTVAAVWGEALGLEELDVHASFFSLGGTSLQVVRIVNSLREALDLDIPLRSLFDAPTVAELAAHIERLQWTVRSQQTPLDLTGAREEGEL